MLVTLKKDSQGKLLPPSNEELAAALAVDDTLPKKHNGPAIAGQCVLVTALQGGRGAVKGGVLQEGVNERVYASR